MILDLHLSPDLAVRIVLNYSEERLGVDQAAYNFWFEESWQIVPSPLSLQLTACMRSQPEDWPLMAFFG